MRLIATDVDIEASWKGYTPLCLAVDESLVPAVRALLDAGANYWVRDPETGESLLHLAAARGSESLVELFLSLGIHVDDRDSFGRTPLFYAAGSVADTDAVVDVLLTQGAVADVQERLFGTTPLIEACRFCKPRVVRALLNHGADVRTVAWDDEDALAAAELNECEEVIALLKSLGASE